MLIPKSFTKILTYISVAFFALIVLPTRNISAQDIQKDTKVIHRVRPGESLNKIARRYLPLTEELTVEDLVEKIKVP